MPATVFQRALRPLNRAFHVALPLLLVGLLVALPLLERWARYPWLLALVAAAVALAAAGGLVVALQRMLRHGRTADLVLAIGFGSAAATYSFAAITSFTGAAGGLTPHDALGRLVLSGLLLASAWYRRSGGGHRELDARDRAFRGLMIFGSIEFVLAVSALVGAIGFGTRGGQGLGPLRVDPFTLTDVVSAALFAAAALVAAIDGSHARRPARRTAMVVGSSLLAVGTLVIVLARPERLDSVIGQLTVGVGIVVCASGLVRRAGAEFQRLHDGVALLAGRLDDGVFLLDDALRVEWMNGAGGLLTGIPPWTRGVTAHEVFGEAAEALLEDEADRDGVAVATPTSIVVESAPVTGRPLALAVSRVGDDGDTALLLVVARDLLPERQTVDELERVSMELTSALAQRDELRRSLDVERAERERLTTRDAVTGVLNEQAILEKLRTEVAQARRHPHPVAIVLLELLAPGESDGTPDVALDLPLREIALRAQLRLRLGDAMGRLAERRFLIVLPHTDERGAAALAESVRIRVEHEPIRTDGEGVSVALAIGTAVLKPGVEISVDDLLSRAESRLVHRSGAASDDESAELDVRTAAEAGEERQAREQRDAGDAGIGPGARTGTE